MEILVGILVLLLFAAIVLSPLGLVWSLNVLFGLGIAYTFKTWLAAFVLLLLVTNVTKVTKSD